MYMTPPTLKLKLTDKSHFKLSIYDLRHAKLCNHTIKRVKSPHGKAFHKDKRYEANIKYPMSYVYDPTNAKTESI